MNKIIVSIEFALILILGINKISDVVFYVEKPEKSAYQVAVVTTASTTTTKTSSEVGEASDIMALFASTNAAEGAKVFKNVPLATASLREEPIKLVQHYGA